jgi:hypothetical protein
VSVTIYRAPDRGRGETIDPEWVEGYALITERRTVRIPEGRGTIRFEGVAAGILPESAIVTGLPDGVREKNLDADLLSPYTLYARSYGRPVTLRRRGKDGSFVEHRGVIRSGPDGAAIIQTRDGFLAADCTGLDSLAYESVPEGLSAKPTLSIETESPRGGQVTVTLSYLAWGFDWQANYVATMRPDGRSADLFAWVTLANGDVTGFADADTMVIAGNVRREDDSGEQVRPEGRDLLFRCLARPYQSDKVVRGLVAEDIGAFPDTNISEALQRLPGVSVTRFSSAIVDSVTAEDFGDLKLYRVPRRTTVAAKSQKQVALLDKPSVPVEVYYRATLFDDRVDGEAMLALRAQNRKEKGLGLALPAGPVAVFEPREGVQILVGEGAITDKAVNEDVEIDVAPATQVSAAISQLASGKGWTDQRLTVTNANPWPVRFETRLLGSDEWKRTRMSAKSVRKPSGGEYWIAEVPANGSATLRFRLVEVSRGRSRP